MTVNKMTNPIIISMLTNIKNEMTINQNTLCCLLGILIGKKWEIPLKNIGEYKGNYLNDFRMQMDEFSTTKVSAVNNAITNLLENAISDNSFHFLLKSVENSNINQDNIVDCINYLIDVVILGKYDVETKTPEWLNRLTIAILNPIEGSFYDGVAGAGYTGIEAYKHAKENQGNLKLFTQEIDQFLSDILVVKYYMEDIDDFSHKCKNTLLGTSYTNKKFDFSIMFPPLGISQNYNEEQFYMLQNQFPDIRINKTTAEWCFVLNQIQSINEEGRGIICVSNGTLFNSFSKQIRKEILELVNIETIISFPSNSLSSMSSPVNLIIFNKSYKVNTKIHMINAEYWMETKTISSNKKRYILSETNLNKLVENCKSYEEITNVSKSVEITDLIDYNFLPEKYVKQIIISSSIFGDVAITTQNDIMEGSENWLTLSDVAEITLGMNNSKVAERDDSSHSQIIKLSDIQDGVLNIHSAEKYRFFLNTNIEKYKINKNDILVSCKGTAIKLSLIKEDYSHIYISSNLFKITSKTNKIHPLYLKYYLESPLGQYFLKSKQTGSSSVTIINSKDMASIPIYYIELEKQIEFVNQLKTDEDTIQNQIKKLQEKLQKNLWNYYQCVGVDTFMKIQKEDNYDDSKI